MAMAAMICGILSIPCPGLGLVLGIIAVILGIISLNAINKAPALQGGKGFALAGIITGAFGGLLVGPLLLAILIPSLGRARELANRTQCGANSHLIVQACIVYSADNMDVFPIPPGVSSSSTANNLACLWYAVNVTRGTSVSSKSLLCKSDPDVSVPATPGAPALSTSAPLQCSYGIANPFLRGSSTVAPWWKDTMDSTVPIISDCVGGTIADRPPYNSINHNGQGQNIGFGDGRSEWQRTTNLNGDTSWNISTGPESAPGSTGFRSYHPQMNPQKEVAGSYIFK